MPFRLTTRENYVVIKEVGYEVRAGLILPPYLLSMWHYTNGFILRSSFLIRKIETNLHNLTHFFSHIFEN